VRCGRAGNDPSEQDRKFEKGEVMEQELHDEINAAVQLAERKPKLIDALLLERREIDGKLAALGYVPPKKTRKPRTPPAEGTAGPKKRVSKSA
jgi:hypothetical protein